MKKLEFVWKQMQMCDMYMLRFSEKICYDVMFSRSQFCTLDEERTERDSNH